MPLTFDYCLSPQAYYRLPECLYPKESIFRPTSGHWISTFFLTLCKSLEQKDAFS